MFRFMLFYLYSFVFQKMVIYVGRQVVAVYCFGVDCFYGGSAPDHCDWLHLVIDMENGGSALHLCLQCMT